MTSEAIPILTFFGGLVVGILIGSSEPADDEEELEEEIRYLRERLRALRRKKR